MKKFSWNKRKKSFLYAFNGLLYLFQTQHNAWIHSAVGIFVISAGIYLKINSFEWCVISISIGLVFAAELFNTAIEKLTDLNNPEYNKNAGLVKDIAAGGVLISALTAVSVGLIVFLPKIINLF